MTSFYRSLNSFEAVFASGDRAAMADPAKQGESKASPRDKNLRLPRSYRYFSTPATRHGIRSPLILLPSQCGSNQHLADSGLSPGVLHNLCPVGRARRPVIPRPSTVCLQTPLPDSPPRRPTSSPSQSSLPTPSTDNMTIFGSALQSAAICAVCIACPRKESNCRPPSGS